MVAKHPEGTYRCPACGSDRVQGTAWVELNGDAVVPDDAPVDCYWCPDCDRDGREGYFEKHVCFDDGKGRCQWCGEVIPEVHAVGCDMDEDCTCGKAQNDGAAVSGPEAGLPLPRNDYPARKAREMSDAILAMAEDGGPGFTDEDFAPFMEAALREAFEMGRAESSRAEEVANAITGNRSFEGFLRACRDAGVTKQQVEAWMDACYSIGAVNAAARSWVDGRATLVAAMAESIRALNAAWRKEHDLMKDVLSGKKKKVSDHL